MHVKGMGVGRCGSKRDEMENRVGVAPRCMREMVEFVCCHAM